MVRAFWNGAVIAESDSTVVIDGNHYFPPGDVNDEYVVGSSTRTVCPWKGQASYLSVVVDGEENEDAAWFYPVPKDAAASIADHVAFWKGVRVEAA